MYPYDEIMIAATLGWMSIPAWGTPMFKFFSKPLPTLEKWATHNAKKATPDDLIAGAVIASFAEHFKHWVFIGSFNQEYNRNDCFRSTSLHRKMVGKKHVLIDFLFKETHIEEDRSQSWSYRAIGCEVNGIRISDAAFKAIYTHWNNIVVKVKYAEEVAAKAKTEMEANEKRWDLAEGLLGMRRNGLGLLVPVKTVEE